MASIEAGEVRPFEERDVRELLDLMRGLADFEGYADEFQITELDIVERGLCATPDFSAYVVPRSGTNELLGMAVTYRIDWTYFGRSNVVLKELFVRENARGLGVGKKLMNVVMKEARGNGAKKLLWTILPCNRRAKSFYSALGATPDTKWENWEVLL